MWLLNCSTFRLEWHDVDAPNAPPYWILSHTWADDEVSYQDMQDIKTAARKKGFIKIRGMCNLASSHDVQHVWIDTCCIDKTSSAELSESINSMFYWYQKAARCVAYLEELDPCFGIATEDGLRGCRWFTRGWTLQELLAPARVDFYDSGWRFRGERSTLCAELSKITGIDSRILERPDVDAIRAAPVAQRMSWAADRQTTRVEDMAYCLLGIFGVNMPLLYGEREHAFIRLQQTIARHVNDMSIFAWVAEPEYRSYGRHYGLLARRPSQFALCGSVQTLQDPMLPPRIWNIENAWLEMRTALDTCTSGSAFTLIGNGSGPENVTVQRIMGYTACYRLPLDCFLGNLTAPSPQHRPEPREILSIWLYRTPRGFVRYRAKELCAVKPSAMRFTDTDAFHFATYVSVQNRDTAFGDFGRPAEQPGATLSLKWDGDLPDSLCQIRYYPAHLWDRDLLNIPHLGSGDKLRGDDFMGLVEISITTDDNDRPSTTRNCWLLCGLGADQEGGSLRPWMHLLPEEQDGTIIINEYNVIQCSRFRNPFTLYSVLGKLRELNAGSAPGPPSAKVIMPYNEVACVELSAGDIRTRPSRLGIERFEITVHVRVREF